MKSVTLHIKFCTTLGEIWSTCKMFISWVTEFHPAYTLYARNLQGSTWKHLFFPCIISALEKSFLGAEYSSLQLFHSVQSTQEAELSTIDFSFSTLMLNFILFCSTMRWTGHISSVRQAVALLVLVKNLTFTHPLF